MIPVIAAAAAAAMGVETLTLRKAVGVCCSALGAAVVVAFGVSGDGGGEANPDSSKASVVVGNLILLGQCVCMGVLLVLQKSLMSSTGLPPTTTTFFYNVIAALISLVATPILVGGDVASYRFTTWQPLLATLYGAVFGLCFIYVVLGWATARTSPTIVSLSMTLQPPLNALLSVLFMGRTSFTFGEVCGGLLISAGLVVTVAFRDTAKTQPDDAATNGALSRSDSESDDGHLALGSRDELARPLADDRPGLDAGPHEDRDFV